MSRVGGVALVAVLLAAPGRASEPARQIDAAVVADQTVTNAGREFYRQFVVAWSDKERTERYSLSIHEKPSARWGSLIWIEFAQRRVYQTFVFPSRADYRALGTRAADTAYESVVEADVQRLLLREPDVGPDEI